MGDISSPFRYLQTFVSDDQFTFAVLGSAGGKEMKLMELTYDRNKSGPTGSGPAPAPAAPATNPCCSPCPCPCPCPCGCDRPTPQPSPCDGPPERVRLR